MEIRCIKPQAFVTRKYHPLFYFLFSYIFSIKCLYYFFSLFLNLTIGACGTALPPFYFLFTYLFSINLFYYFISFFLNSTCSFPYSYNLTLTVTYTFIIHKNIYTNIGSTQFDSIFYTHVRTI